MDNFWTLPLNPGRDSTWGRSPDTGRHRQSNEKMAVTFVVCFEKQDSGDFSTEDITVGRLYELVEEDAGNGMVRIIDESGEDYLYPSSWFESITLRDSIALRLHDALARRAA